MLQRRSLVLLALLAALGTPTAAAQELSWHLTRIPAPEPAYGLFGASLALSGDTLAVSAVEKTLRTYIVYIYGRQGDGWVREATLHLGNPQRVNIPPQLALSDGTLVVGRPYEEPAALNSGTVFVYVRRQGAWVQEARLRTVGGILFGYAVAVAGDTLAAGVLVTTDRQVGAVVVYRRSGGVWRQEARLAPRRLAPGAQFGNALALAGDRLAVGAHFDAQTPGRRGSLWIYSRRGATWRVEQRLLPEQGADQLGETVSFSGDHLAAGELPDRAQIYQRQPDGWRPQARLARPDDPDAYGYFGFFAALGGARAVVVGNRFGAGHQPAFGAYLFEESGGRWESRGLLDDSLRPYGYAMAVAADTVVLGSPRQGPSGEVHVWTPD